MLNCKYCVLLLLLLLVCPHFSLILTQFIFIRIKIKKFA
jgi:hypothetical protein